MAHLLLFGSMHLTQDLYVNGILGTWVEQSASASGSREDRCKNGLIPEQNSDLPPPRTRVFRYSQSD